MFGDQNLAVHSHVHDPVHSKKLRVHATCMILLKFDSFLRRCGHNGEDIWYAWDTWEIWDILDIWDV